MDRYYDVFETPFGWMGVLASSSGLRLTTLPHPSPEQCVALLGKEADEADLCPDRFTRLRSGLVQYFSGALVSFAYEPIDLGDAPRFYRAAWEACRSIPIGKTRSYKWLAAQAGRPRALRAAGQSMARNPLPIVVPCHRVIASDGSLGGFGKGRSLLHLKRRLLDLEARHLGPPLSSARPIGDAAVYPSRLPP